MKKRMVAASALMLSLAGCAYWPDYTYQVPVTEGMNSARYQTDMNRCHEIAHQLNNQRAYGILLGGLAGGAIGGALSGAAGAAATGPVFPTQADINQLFVARYHEFYRRCMVSMGWKVLR